MKRLLHDSLAAVLVIALGMLAVSCGDDSTPKDTENTYDAYLRALHLVTDGPAVDILANGETNVVSDLSYGQGTAYQMLKVGMYDFDVVPMGGTVADSVLSITGVDLVKDLNYTAIAYGSAANIKSLILQDTYTDLQEGDVRVRVIHTAGGLGEVDVWNIPIDATPVLLYENLTYGQVGNYMDIGPGTYTLGIDVDNDANPDMAFNMPQLNAGDVINVFVVKDNDGIYLLGQAQDGTVTKVMPEDVANTADLRMIHLSPDTQAVDILVNGSAKIQNLAFGEGSEYLTFDPSTIDVAIVPTGGAVADTLLDIPDLTLGANKSYTVAVLGMASNLSSLILNDDYSDLADGSIRVRVIHAADGVGEVDIWNIPDTGDPALLYENMGYGTVSDTTDLAVGAYTLGIDVDNDASPDLLFTMPGLAVGSMVNIFVVKDGDNVYLLAQTGDGSVTKIDPEP